jgi:hypothetical protein
MSTSFSSPFSNCLDGAGTENAAELLKRFSISTGLHLFAFEILTHTHKMAHKINDLETLKERHHYNSLI